MDEGWKGDVGEITRTEYSKEHSFLYRRHLEMIQASGISPEVSCERGYRTETVKEVLGELGFSPAQRRTPALVIPIWDVNGKCAGCQLRPDNPRERDGKALKYETPAGMRMVIDVPPRCRPMLGDPKVRLLVTEGVRKADAAASRGLCCIDVPGVWCWRGTNEKGGRTALADWDEIALNDREVLVCFDSDVTHKPEVRHALDRLRGFLERRGAHVNVIYLPDGADGQKVGLDDYLATVNGEGELLALANASINGAGGARVEGCDWPETEEIGGELLGVPTLKETLIPEALRSWVLDTAERFQCPPDYFAAAALVEAGQLLGRKIAIRPKQHDNWYEHANLWGGIVAPPGFMKSPAIREAFLPLFRLEREARTKYDDAKRTAEVAREIAESQRTIIRNRLRGKDLRDSEREQLARQLSEVAFEEPVCRRYIVNDVTVEKVGELLNQNPNGLALLCDELSGWMGLMEQPEHVNARAFYLSAWSGKTAYTYDRIGRGSLFIEAACLSVFGALVPGTLERYLRATFSGERADGFIQRFQLLVYPDLPGKWHYVDRPIDEAARARAFHVLERLGALTVDDFHAARIEEEAPFVRFTPAAQSIWMGAHEWCMGLARSKDEHPVLRSHFSKYPKLLAALALVFHALRVADGHAGEAIEKESIDLAWAWAQYLEGHARRVYQLALNPGETAARLIAEKLREQRLPNPFSVREVQRKEWTGLRAKGDVLAGLEVLEECNWVRSEPPAPGKPGRPTSRFWVNPRVSK